MIHTNNQSHCELFIKFSSRDSFILEKLESILFPYLVELAQTLKIFSLASKTISHSSHPNDSQPCLYLRHENRQQPRSPRSQKC